MRCHLRLDWVRAICESRLFLVHDTEWVYSCQARFDLPAWDSVTETYFCWTYFLPKVYAHAYTLLSMVINSSTASTLVHVTMSQLWLVKHAS